MRRVLAGLGVVLWIAVVATAAYVWRRHDPHAGHAPQASLGAMDATYLPFKGAAPLRAPALARPDGSAFPANGLEGRWTLLFFGFTSCPDVCPTTLDALSRARLDPATQIVFISIDPERDTPARLAEYLSSFDRRIVGLRGGAEDVKRFAEAAGAGFSREAGQVDHSTSVFVVDPRARVAGVLLRASEPARIVADLGTLQRGDAR